MRERRLVVNVDHVATLRQARRGVLPDPVAAATLALIGGADGIVVHLREDRRHVQERDVRVLRELLPAGFHLEMAATDEMLALARRLRPDSVTLVPERREELTTEGGLDVRGQADAIRVVVEALHEVGIRSCLFIDPDAPQVEAASRVGARSVEIHTGAYANAPAGTSGELARIFAAIRHAEKGDLEIGVGHGLDSRNVAPLAEVEAIEEFSIGHSIVARAVLVGMERATREMKRALSGS